MNIQNISKKQIFIIAIWVFVFLLLFYLLYIQIFPKKMKYYQEDDKDLVASAICYERCIGYTNIRNCIMKQDKFNWSDLQNKCGYYCNGIVIRECGDDKRIYF